MVLRLIGRIQEQVVCLTSLVGVWRQMVCSSQMWPHQVAISTLHLMTIPMALWREPVWLRLMWLVWRLWSRNISFSTIQTWHLPRMPIWSKPSSCLQPSCTSTKKLVSTPLRVSRAQVSWIRQRLFLPVSMWQGITNILAFPWVMSKTASLLMLRFIISRIRTGRWRWLSIPTQMRSRMATLPWHRAN